jgi:hypothetical protein
MDSDHLFGIFKLFLHITRTVLFTQVYVTLAKFDYPDYALWVFCSNGCQKWGLLQQRLYIVSCCVIFRFVDIEEIVGTV